MLGGAEEGGGAGCSQGCCGRGGAGVPVREVFRGRWRVALLAGWALLTQPHAVLRSAILCRNRFANGPW